MYLEMTQPVIVLFYTAKSIKLTKNFQMAISLK